SWGSSSRLDVEQGKSWNSFPEWPELVRRFLVPAVVVARAALSAIVTRAGAAAAATSVAAVVVAGAAGASRTAAALPGPAPLVMAPTGAPVSAQDDGMTHRAARTARAGARTWVAVSAAPRTLVTMPVMGDRTPPCPR